jgi:L-ascorbate metabolism protein UlaG (beta-lactamase superfamily)
MTARPTDETLPLRITYIGGPTALLEVGGLRLLTDPTFDPAGTEYPTPVYTLRKTQGPAVAANATTPLDAVLLSHDHHVDNLDRAGRALLGRARRVLTTPDAAARLGGAAMGLRPWQTTELTGGDGGVLTITATPARHGPEDGDRGPVTGFVLTRPEQRGGAIYVSGDTVWFHGVEEVGRHFDVRVALLFMGAARVREVGPAHLTFTASEGVQVAQALPGATIVPLHYEGWEHFSESRDEIEHAFNRAGLAERLRWPGTGRAVEV